MAKIVRRAIEAVRQASREHILNLSSYLGVRLVALAVFAWSVSYYLSIADASSYGEVTLLLAILSLLQASDFGLAYAFNLRLTRANPESEERNRIVRSGALFYLLVALSIGLMLTVFAPIVSEAFYGNNSKSESVRYLGISVSLSLASSFYSSIVQAYNKLYLLNASRGISEILKAIALCVGAHLGIEIFALLLAGVTATKLVLDLYLAGRLVGFQTIMRPHLSFKGIRQDLSLGVPMFMAILLSMSVTVIDKAYVSRVFGTERLGYYSIAYDLSSKVFFLAFAVTSSLYVVSVRRFAEGRSARQLIWIGFAGVLAVGFFYYLPLAVFAPNVLRMWIDVEVSERATAVTRSGVLMGLAYLAMNVLYNALQAAGKSMRILFGWAMAVIWMVFALWQMPRSWGDVGVMLVLASAFVLQAVYYGYEVLQVSRARKGGLAC